MDRSVKVTISLPADVLAEIESECKARNETRSAFIRVAVDQAIRERRAKADIARYVRGYEQYPESDEELALADQLSRAVLLEEQWV